MNSPTISMERDAALSKLESYEQAMRDNPKAFRELDRGVMQGYRVLAKGGRLVDVNEAIKEGGLNLAGLPKLAIARAHVVHTEWRQADVSNEAGGGCFAWLPDRVGWWSSRHQGSNWRWKIPAGTFDIHAKYRRDVKALCPLIPLPLRPKFKLDNYFLLWEANWFPAPPRDPYLLKPLAGALMEIVAEWEVTPLELAAVRASMQPQR